MYYNSFFFISEHLQIHRPMCHFHLSWYFKMDRKRAVSETDNNLWRKIKRNGHFSKRKREIIKQFERKSVLSVSDVASAADIEKSDREDFASPTRTVENGPRPILNVASPKYDDVSENNESDGEFEETTESFNDPQDLCDDIKQWAIDFQIKHTAINALLVILKSHIPENVLPKCARTLVQTPRSTVISKDHRLGGQYWHYGLRKILQETLSRFENVPKSVSLNVNIDGLPAFKSSSKSFWPILVNMHELREIQSPLIVGLFCGGSMFFLVEYEHIITMTYIFRQAERCERFP